MELVDILGQRELLDTRRVPPAKNQQSQGELAGFAKNVVFAFGLMIGKI